MSSTTAPSASSSQTFGVPSTASCLLLGYLTGSFAGFIVGYLALQLSDTVHMESGKQTLGVVMIFGLAGGILGACLGLIHRLLARFLRHTPPVFIGFSLFSLAGLALALFGGELEATKIILTIAPFSLAGSIFGVGTGRAAEIDAAKAANQNDR